MCPGLKPGHFQLYLLKILEYIFIYKMADSTALLKKNPIRLFDSSLSEHSDTLFIKVIPQDTAIDPDTLFGMSEDTAKFVIPVIVTISIFFLTQVIGWVKRKWEKHTDIENYRGIILDWVELMGVAVNQQIDACLDIATRLSSVQNIHPEPFQFNKFNVDKVEAISIDKYIATFVTNATGEKKVNDKMTYNFVSNFGYLKGMEKEIQTVYDDYQEQTFRVMDEWNVAFRKLDDLISTQVVKIRINSEVLAITGAYHIQVRDTVNAYISSIPGGRANVAQSIDGLITPLRVITNQELKVQPQNDYAFNISATLQDLRLVVMQWEANTKGAKIRFETVANNLKLSYKGLTDAREHYIKNAPLKFFLRVK